MNNTLAAVRLVTVDPDEVASLRDGIVDVYRRVFTEPPWDETPQQVEEFIEHLVEWRAFTPGFRLVVALDGDLVAGFAMGASWDPDNWWCEAVTRDVHPDMTRSCFHLMELALLPGYRGGGLGGRLHDELLADVDAHTAILSTNELGPPAAAALYVNRGWQLLLRSWAHCDTCPTVHVLGLTLRPPG